MLFELPNWTQATLTGITTRTEKHGEEEKSAISLHFKIKAANTLLDHLDPTLRPTLYKATDTDVLPGVDPTTPLLRTRGIEQLTSPACFEGWALHVDHGIEEGAPLIFGGCKVDKFRVTPHEGGSIDMLLRVGTSDLDAKKFGIVGMKNGQDVQIQIHKPVPKKDAIDGTAANFKAETGTDGGGTLFDQANAQAEAKKSEGDPATGEKPKDWPFPKNRAPATADPVLDAAKEAHGLGKGKTSKVSG